MTVDSITHGEFGSQYAQGAPFTPEREQARSELDMMSAVMIEEQGLLDQLRRGCFWV